MNPIQVVGGISKAPFSESHVIFHFDSPLKPRPTARL
jgi:hypothetical protein